MQGGGKRGYRVDAEMAAGGGLVPIGRSAFDPGRDSVGTLTTGIQRRPGGDQEQELLIAVDTYNGTVGDVGITVRGARPDHLPHVIAFGHTNGIDVQASETVTPTLRAGHDVGGGSDASASAVRRLTPTECERLQGYPDGWTATSYGRAQVDSARYRQLGNSIAVPVFTWVADGIAGYEASHE